MYHQTSKEIYVEHQRNKRKWMHKKGNGCIKKEKRQGKTKERRGRDR